MAGHIRKRYDSSWIVTVDLGRDPLTGKRIRKQRSIKGTKRDAEKLLRQMEYEAETGRIGQASDNLRFGAFLDQWLTNTASNAYRIRTYERYEELIRGRVIPALGHIPLTKLQPMHLQGFYNSLLEDGARKDGKPGGLSPRTIQHHHNAIHAALETAVKWQLITRNVASSVSPPRVEEKEPIILDMKQTAILYEEASKSRWFAAIILAATTGMRRGEILGLRWQDIDWDAPALHLVQAVSATKTKGTIITEIKTRQGRRRIPIFQSAADALQKQKARQAEERLLAGAKWQDNDLVFCKSDGTPFHPSQFTNDFRKMVRSLGLPHVTPHGLRHTHASQLLAQGWHSKMVSERLGHARTSITDDIYSHLLPGLQDAAIAELEDRFFNTK